MSPDRSLSKNFTLHGLLVSQTASRMRFLEQYEPSDAAVNNLTALCTNVLELLRGCVCGVDSKKAP